MCLRLLYASKARGLKDHIQQGSLKTQDLLIPHKSILTSNSQRPWSPRRESRRIKWVRTFLWSSRIESCFLVGWKPITSFQNGYYSKSLRRIDRNVNYLNLHYHADSDPQTWKEDYSWLIKWRSRWNEAIPLPEFISQRISEK